MQFLKNLFNDDDTIIGLCGFDLEKRKYNKNLLSSSTFSPKTNLRNIFETKIERNILLSV